MSLPFIYDLCEVTTPPILGRNLPNVDFAEVIIHLAIASYTASLASAGSILHPTQEMVNGISEDIAKADARHPPYMPYIAPDYTARPWLHMMALRTTDIPKRRDRISRAW